MAYVVPNSLQAHTRERIAKAKFDLARLALTSRIELLDSGYSSALDEELITKYLSKPPEDPFTGTMYLWDTQDRTYYSLGPDKSDNYNGVSYDPTNGTLSMGDVSL